jgi:hypothetical protein
MEESRSQFIIPGENSGEGRFFVSPMRPEIDHLYTAGNPVTSGMSLRFLVLCRRAFDMASSELLDYSLGQTFDRRNKIRSLGSSH